MQESNAIRGLVIGLILSIALWVLGYWGWQLVKLLWQLGKLVIWRLV